MNPQLLLDRIAHLQCPGDHVYLPGLFSSQRFHRHVPYQREDNNIFFSTLVAFTLQQLLPHLGPLKPQATQLINEVIQNHRYYRKHQHQPSYNFWRTKPSRHFPNGWLLRHFDFFELADDSDDSAMIHLTGDIPLSHSELLLNQLARQYPPEQPNSALTPKGYQDLKGYPTFLGKKIRREMDACVLSNILYLVLKKDLPWTDTANHSLTFLERVIARGDFIKIPFAIAPHYGNTAVIFYHLTRLYSAFPHTKVNVLGPLLYQQLEPLRSMTWSFMEELLLATSSLRLDEEWPKINLPTNLDQEFKRFSFFQAGMLTAFQNKRLSKLAEHEFFHLKFRCEAYYYTLLLEYLVLKDHSNP